MPKNYGKKIKKGKGRSGLGSSLMKSRNRKIVERKQYIVRNKAEDIDEKSGTEVLESCLERNSLNDFLYDAELRQEQFNAVRGPRLVFRDLEDRQVVIDRNSNQIEQNPLEQKTQAVDEIGKMRIPRKPKWDGARSIDQQKLLENTSFTDWRRRLAEVEDKYRFVTMTPYEKNVELWKQLWRVVERSDIVIQIVDGRDPLFYRCQDLETYTKEIDSNKMNMLLVNKSDLLPDDVRSKWSTYFNSRGIDHIFFSAKIEQEDVNLNEEDEEVNVESLPVLKEEDFGENTIDDFKNTPHIVQRNQLKYILKKTVLLYKEANPNMIIQHSDGVSDEKYTEEIAVMRAGIAQLREENKKEVLAAPEGEEPLDEEDVARARIRIRGREVQMVNIGSKLLELMKKRNDLKHQNLVTIGMVGYPNVGKSSVINVLCGKKLVGVDSRPGKTKNFQTIFLEKDLLLCDCPGLVFPSVVSSKAQMVCNGVVPIANLREYMPPMKYICARIHRKVFEFIFKFSCPGEEERAEAGKLLHYFATSRGYIRAGSGTPNYHAAAVFMLKRLVKGELLLAKLPVVKFQNGKEIDALLVEDTIQEEMTAYVSNDVPEDHVPSYAMNNNENNNKGKAFETYDSKDQKMDKVYFAKEEIPKIEVMEFEQQDIIDFVMGKRVQGHKLDKFQRRELKFAIKRDENSETIYFMLDSFLNGVKNKIINKKEKGKGKKRTAVTGLEF